MEDIRSKVKSHISNNETNKAIAVLLSGSQNNKVINNSLQIVLGEYNDLVSQRLKGVVSNSEVTMKTNSIHDRLLIALESFDDNGNILPTAKIEPNDRTGKLFKYGLLLSIIGGATVVVSLANEKEVNDDWIYVIAFLGYFICMGGLILLGGWFVSFVFKAIRGK